MARQHVYLADEEARAVAGHAATNASSVSYVVRLAVRAFFGLPIPEGMRPAPRTDAEKTLTPR